MTEEAVAFGKLAALIGVIADPPNQQTGRDLPAVLLLNSGIVHRVGPNRLYVRMARSLAEMGHVVLRFDFSGIGDSGRRADNLPFVQAAIQETQEAMDLLRASRGTNQFVLAGICSGALISLRTAVIDPRVCGVISINLAGHRSCNGLYYGRALLRHYKRIALSKSFGLRACRNAIFGSFDSATLVGAVLSLVAGLFTRKQAASQQPMPFQGLLRELVDSGISVALIHSEGDEGLDYMNLALGDELRQWSAEEKLQFLLIRGANHTFTLLENQQDVLDSVCGWMQKYRQRAESQVAAGRA